MDIKKSIIMIIFMMLGVATGIGISMYHDTTHNVQAKDNVPDNFKIVSRHAESVDGYGATIERLEDETSSMSTASVFLLRDGSGKVVSISAILH